MNNINTKYRLCIGTPMFNAEPYLMKLLDSVGNIDIDWIIYLDGCTDNTLATLTELSLNYDKVRFHIIYSEVNRNLTYGRNIISDKFVTEVSKSGATHLVMLDADDWMNVGWHDKIIHWLDYVSLKYPDPIRDPYCCFKYWNERRMEGECEFYTKLNTNYHLHAIQNQYPDGGVDILHVIPTQYLIEVKEVDGNYYHVVESETWTPDMHNFHMYTEYPVSFIADLVATIGAPAGNMSDSYYNNIVTKYARGQYEEIRMIMNTYGSKGVSGYGWDRIPSHRYRWMAKCLVRMIENGTLVFSGKKWD